MPFERGCYRGPLAQTNKKKRPTQNSIEEDTQQKTPPDISGFGRVIQSGPSRQTAAAAAADIVSHSFVIVEVWPRAPGHCGCGFFCATGNRVGYVDYAPADAVTSKVTTRSRDYLSVFYVRNVVIESNDCCKVLVNTAVLGQSRAGGGDYLYFGSFAAATLLKRCWHTHALLIHDIQAMPGVSRRVLPTIHYFHYFVSHIIKQ